MDGGLLLAPPSWPKWHPGPGLVLAHWAVALLPLSSPALPTPVSGLIKELCGLFMYGPSPSGVFVFSHYSQLDKPFEQQMERGWISPTQCVYF